MAEKSGRLRHVTQVLLAIHLLFVTVTPCDADASAFFTADPTALCSGCISQSRREGQQGNDTPYPILMDVDCSCPCHQLVISPSVVTAFSTRLVDNLEPFSFDSNPDFIHRSPEHPPKSF